MKTGQQIVNALKQDLIEDAKSEGIDLSKLFADDKAFNQFVIGLAITKEALNGLTPCEAASKVLDCDIQTEVAKLLAAV